MSRETSHPLIVQARQGEVTPCYRDRECHLWGMGTLMVARKNFTECRTKLALAAIGCETCTESLIPQGDLGVIPDFRNTFRLVPGEPITPIETAALVMLSEVVSRFAPPEMGPQSLL